MDFINVLNSITVYGETYDVYLNWIGKIIDFLTSSLGSVGIGILVFSLILKLIVLPFDIYQRIAMRKQNIQMKENQAKMEKLQKQYANNKEMYNQKVMEMYKENGFSMFSSCLPMILSMVIFIVAIDAFNVYAQYSSVQNYNIMVDAYNAAILEKCPELSAETVSVDGDRIIVKADDKEVFYSLKKPADDIDFTANNYAYIKSVSNSEKVFESNVADKTDEDFEEIGRQAVVKVYDEEIIQNTKFLWIQNIWKTDAIYEKPLSNGTKFSQELSAKTSCLSSASGVQFYVNGEKVSFKELAQKDTAYYTETYDDITKNLTVQKNRANGYFILVALSIGTILLQQFVTMRSQKEQQQFSTVDGQGAQQQKMTMIIMTGMFAIFSFMYSAAFSLYMVTSNIFSLVSTLVINKAVDKAEEAKERKALQEKHNQRFPGRKAPTEKKENKK